MNRDILGVFPDAMRGERIAYWLWLEYYVRTERFDRRVCTSLRHGDAFPADNFERAAIDRNAREEMKRVQFIADAAKCTADEMERAKHWASRLSFDHAVEVLSHEREALTKAGVDWKGYLAAVGASW